MIQINDLNTQLVYGVLVGQPRPWLEISPCYGFNMTCHLWAHGGEDLIPSGVFWKAGKPVQSGSFL